MLTPERTTDSVLPICRKTASLRRDAAESTLRKSNAELALAHLPDYPRRIRTMKFHRPAVLWSVRTFALTAVSNALLGYCSSLLAATPEWPEFRGPQGNGTSSAQDIPVRWSETENVVWKTELPGKGYSSPVIDGDQIWMTTAVDEPVSDEEKARRLKANTGNQPLIVAGRLVLRALCVQRETGKLVHDLELMVESEPQPAHALNSFASPTPVDCQGAALLSFRCVRHGLR